MDRSRPAVLLPVCPDTTGRLWAAATGHDDRGLIDGVAWGLARHRFVRRWANGLLELGGPRLRDAGIVPSLHLWGRPWLLLDGDVAGGMDAYRAARTPDSVDRVVASQLAAVGIDAGQVVVAQTSIAPPDRYRQHVAAMLAWVGETVAAAAAGLPSIDGPAGPIGTDDAVEGAVSDVLSLAAALNPGWVTGRTGLARRLMAVGVDPAAVTAPASGMLPDGLDDLRHRWVPPGRAGELAAGFGHLRSRLAGDGGEGLTQFSEAIAEAVRLDLGLVELD